jgi:hypothetical protein
MDNLPKDTRLPTLHFLSLTTLSRPQIKSIENNEEVKWQQSTSEVRRTNGLGCGTELQGSFQVFLFAGLIFLFLF